MQKNKFRKTTEKLSHNTRNNAITAAAKVHTKFLLRLLQIENLQFSATLISSVLLGTTPTITQEQNALEFSR